MAKLPKGPPDVSGYGNIEPTKGFDRETKFTKPEQRQFETYMEKPSAKPEEASSKPTPMELAQNKDLLSSPTNESVLAQTANANNTMMGIQDQLQRLQTKNISLKPSDEKLLSRKMQDSIDHLNTAASHLDLKKPSLKIDQNKDPITRFLSYLSYGQDQMVEAKKKLAALQKQKKSLNPSQMMLIQINLAQAQQSLEFSSILLSKTIDALKQLMNIQI